jgi:hypothetical protein
MRAYRRNVYYAEIHDTMNKFLFPLIFSSASIPIDWVVFPSICFPSSSLRHDGDPGSYVGPHRRISIVSQDYQHNMRETEKHLANL